MAARKRPTTRKRLGRPASSAEGTAVMVSLRLRPEVRRALAEAGRRYGSQSEAIAQALEALEQARP